MKHIHMNHFSDLIQRLRAGVFFVKRKRTDFNNENEPSWRLARLKFTTKTGPF